MTDGDLLGRYVQDKDEAAFAEVVRHNGPLVLRVCRSILGEATAAEDAFQATFLLLARRASRLTRPGSLAGWLHASAVRIAQTARRTEARKRHREFVYKPVSTAGSDELAWREIREILDAELAALPEKYRIPLVLCYLQELSYGEAARRAGCSVGALRGRLERGKGRLRKRLGDCGLTLGVPLLMLGPQPPVSAAIREATLIRVRSLAVNSTMPIATTGLAAMKIAFRTAILAPIVLVVAAIAGLGIPSQAGDGYCTASDTPDVRLNKEQQILQGKAERNAHVSLIGRAPTPKIAPPTVIALENVWRLHQVGELKRDASHLDWIPGTRELAIIPWMGEIEIFDVRELKSLRKLASGKQLVNFAFSRDGERLAWAENTTSFTIANLNTKEMISFETGNRQPNLVFSPDGKWLATGGYGTKATLWEVATGKKVRDFETDVLAGLTPVFSPDGTVLALGSRKSDPRLFSTATGKLLHVLPKKETQEIRFNPAGTILATTYVDGSIGLWNVATGESIKEVKTAAEELYRVDWSPKGDLLLTTGLNAKIILWDAKTLKPVKELEGPEWVIAARFTPDGTRIVTAGGTIMKSPDRKITVWGVENR